MRLEIKNEDGDLLFDSQFRDYTSNKLSYEELEKIASFCCECKNYLSEKSSKKFIRKFKNANSNNRH